MTARPGRTAAGLSWLPVGLMVPSVCVAVLLDLWLFDVSNDAQTVSWTAVVTLTAAPVLTLVAVGLAIVARVQARRAARSAPALWWAGGLAAVGVASVAAVVAVVLAGLHLNDMLFGLFKLA